MSKQSYPHPEDEFDALGADRVPQGVHRQPVPRWRQWLPYLLVLILAPTIAFTAVKLLTDDGGDTAGGGGASSTSAAPPSGVETSTEAPPEETTPPAEETTTEPPAPAVDKSVAVEVLNGASVAGLAGRTQEKLSTDGWSAVGTGNYSKAKPAESTVFYGSPDHADEAQAVAELLGIATVTEDATAAKDGIVVVLRKDFSE